MNKTILAMGLSLLSPLAWGQVDVEEDEPTTESGIVSEFIPGQVIVIEHRSPMRFQFGPSVTYITENGTVLHDAAIRERIHEGVPVSVYYTETGEQMIVNRVIVNDSED